MAKGIYVGVGDIARKVKKLFVGVNDVARKVKKVFVGVGGVPKLVYSAEFSYVGSAPQLTNAIQNMDSSSVGDYALFAASNVADAYNSSLVKSTATISGDSVFEINAGRNDNYAIFAGGQTTSYSWLSSVNAINSSLVRTSATSLSNAQRFLFSGRVGQYALFFGSSATLDAYASNLVRTTKYVSETVEKGSRASATIDNYAILAGGGSSGSPSSKVMAFNTSLIESSPTSLSYSRAYCAGASVGGKALVAGGASGYMYSYASVSHVEAFDNSLVKSIVTSLSRDSTGLTGSTVDGYAIFSGGQSIDSVNQTSSYNDFVDVYDESLVKTSLKMSIARHEHCGAIAGNYLLLGGKTSGKTLDAFEF